VFHLLLVVTLECKFHYFILRAAAKPALNHAGFEQFTDKSPTVLVTSHNLLQI